MALRLRVPLVMPAGLAACGIAVGLMAGLDPKLAIAGALGLAFAALVLADITLGLCLFAFIAFLDALRPTGDPAFGFTKAAGLLLVLSWLATVATRDEAKNDFVSSHPAITYLLASFVGWAALSLLWAENLAEGQTEIFRYLQNLFLFLIVFTAVRTRQHVVWVLTAFVLGAAVAGTFAVLNPPQSGLEEVSRAAGTIGDPNELASVLVAGVVLAGILVVLTKGSPLLRLGAGCAALLCAGGILFSLSRGGLLALGFALVMSFFVAGRWRARAATLGVLALISAVAYFAAFAPIEARQRVTTVGGGSGRSDIWTVGWRMVEDHPVRGVGAGNFKTSSIHYLLEPGAIKRDEFIIDTPKVAHNMYLQVLAELGIVGLSLFLAILAFSLNCAVRAARRFMELGDTRMEIVSRGLVVALLGVLAADFFISGQFSKQLWLLLGLGPSLLAVAMKGKRDEPTVERLDQSGRPALAEGTA
jgi:putative inorganic carbon (HCO3(-)) transporter